MLSFEKFKESIGVTEIKFLKSPKTGRQVADLKGINLVISLKADLTKPLYVTECQSSSGEDILVICNQGWEEGVKL